MDGQEYLAQRFESERVRLLRVAQRMLGSSAEAEDAVQDAWLRLSRSASAEPANISGWLTTVVARICLDALRSRKARFEEPVAELPAHLRETGEDHDPQAQAVLADSMSLALLAVLEALSPPQRVAFVLHDMFDVPFETIAEIIGCSPQSARQLASRARRRVRGSQPQRAQSNAQHERIVRAFLDAARGGRLDELVALLHPHAVLHADAAAAALGAEPLVKGARAVAQTFSGRAKAARPARAFGDAALVWAQGGTPRVLFAFAFQGAAIASIELIADPGRLQAAKIEWL